MLKSNRNNIPVDQNNKKIKVKNQGIKNANNNESHRAWESSS